MTDTPFENAPSAIVKEKTGDLHDLVEETLGQRFFQNDEMNRDEFIDLLKCFYHVYSPLENRMMPVLRGTLPDYEYDPRAIRLRRDFQELGIDQQTIDGWSLASHADLVELPDAPELFGCLYVVEGSEMGNHVMRSQLDELLPEDCLEANHFFRDRGEATRDRWSYFKERMNERITTSGELDRMVQTARETFELFRKGFEWKGD